MLGILFVFYTGRVICSLARRYVANNFKLHSIHPLGRLVSAHIIQSAKKII